MTTLSTRCVLSINNAWQPIDVVTIESAIIDVYQGKAKIIDDAFTFHGWNSWIEFWRNPEEREKAVAAGRFVIHSVNFSIAAPDVILVPNAKRARRRMLRPTPENVARRDEYTCGYCGKKFSLKRLSRDHIYPESRGGKMDWDNLVAACHRCNGKKRNRTPEEAGMTLLRKPFEPHWLMNHLDEAPPLWRAILKPRSAV